MPRSHDGAKRGAALVEPLEATDPQRVGPFQLLGRLGAGAMGRVYLARSESGRTAAVKVVHEEHTSDRTFRDRFRREVESARRVGDAYTARVLDADPEAARPWIATGYVPGVPLEQLVRENGPLPAGTVKVLAHGLLRALRTVHEADVVHRDLKPSNVMVTVEGPRVIDFGIARALETSAEPRLTGTGMVVGTPGFMAPEQVRGDKVGPKADVFALGCVLTWALTGRLPHGEPASNNHSLMYTIVHDAPKLSLIEDEDLRAFVGRCLVKDAGERPDVETLLAGLPWPEDGARDSEWLPPAVVVRLARQTALLLEIEAPEDVPPAPDADEPASGDASAPRAPSPAPATTTASGHNKTAWIVLAAVLAVLMTSGTVYYFVSQRPDSSDLAEGPTGTATPSVTASAGTASPSASGTKDAGKKEKDEPKGARSDAPEDGGAGPTARPAEAADGDGADAPAGGAGDGGDGSGSSSSGGGEAESNGVPSYFVGTWKNDATFGRPSRITVQRASPGDPAVTFRSTTGAGTPCVYVARLISVQNGGARLNLDTGDLDESRSSMGCTSLAASYLDADEPSGLDYFENKDFTADNNAWKYTRA
ncbi:serine/threonine-protein kinase [Streptomyces xanthii]|uniref:Serine/threonine protein kinase n=1 Tax=Streptomyces xanthii TaxID=2768069 RepID=A0A7H1BGU2_9ACTN|nr:serine/threonine-protein kinase [Streptomyces xanthii]QNS07947.1 serine/threonine protein kinase [Streptomyces xanthii]